MKYYAGIGSRETPREILAAFSRIANHLSKLSYCLRSGGADGADDAFERGAVHKQIFLPWDGFNGRRADGVSYIVPPFEPSYISRFHPAPSRLKQGGLMMMNRNTYQVLGPTLDDPVDFVLCWTKDGKDTGGTGQAIRIAESMNIPVFNAKNGFEDFSKFMTMSILTG